MPNGARQHSIEKGADVRRSLAEITAGGAGWVMAAGSLEALELKIEGTPRRIDGKSVIVSLSGPAGGPYVIAIYRSGQMLAGEMDNARSLGMTVVVVPAEIVRAPEPVAVPEVTAQAGWAASALQTAAVTRASEPDDGEVIPKAGDLVEHFAFGLCEVLMGDEDSLRIRDLHGRGRIREIRLEVLNVSGPAARDGKRLFRLARRN
jgi:hypothetical protein